MSEHFKMIHNTYLGPNNVLAFIWSFDIILFMDLLPLFSIILVIDLCATVYYTQ